MSRSKLGTPTHGGLRNSLWWLLPLAFTTILLLFYPFRFVFEFNPDEGLHLMRSLLYLRGEELYSDVFNDQPPLFTLMLSALFSVLGLNVNLGRLLVLLLSTALVFSALAYLRTQWGQPHAIAAWALFLLLPKYSELSLSVMISLPAIAFAMVSFSTLTLWHRHRSRRLLIISAAALGLSIMIKVFTGLLVPIFAAGLLVSASRRDSSGSKRLKVGPAVVWLLVLALVVGAIALLAIGPRNLPQLFRVHLSARQSDQYLAQVETHNINYALRDARGILLLALLGAVVALWRRQWSALYLISWALAAYGGLSLVLPVWAHHQLLVTIPSLVLAAIFLGELAIAISDRLRSWNGADRGLALQALGLLGTVVILGLRIPPTISEFNPRLPNFRYKIRALDIRQYEILALMWQHADQTELVVTDRPMYAFRIQKPVPPELAVISEKRLWSGSITQDQIIKIIDAERPEQVLLVRFPLDNVEAHLERSYDAIYRLGEWRLFLRSDLANAGERGRDRAPALADSIPPG